MVIISRAVSKKGGEEFSLGKLKTGYKGIEILTMDFFFFFRKFGPKRKEINSGGAEKSLDKAG